MNPVSEPIKSDAEEAGDLVIVGEPQSAAVNSHSMPCMQGTARGARCVCTPCSERIAVRTLDTACSLDHAEVRFCNGLDVIR